jgi:hypothetical protein
MHHDELSLTNCGSKENRGQDYLAAGRTPPAILPSLASRNTCCRGCDFYKCSDRTAGLAFTGKAVSLHNNDLT